MPTVLKDLGGLPSGHNFCPTLRMPAESHEDGVYSTSSIVEASMLGHDQEEDLRIYKDRLF